MLLGAGRCTGSRDMQMKGTLCFHQGLTVQQWDRCLTSRSPEQEHRECCQWGRFASADGDPEKPSRRKDIAVLKDAWWAAKPPRLNLHGQKWTVGLHFSLSVQNVYFAIKCHSQEGEALTEAIFTANNHHSFWKTTTWIFCCFFLKPNTQSSIKVRSLTLLMSCRRSYLISPNRSLRQLTKAAPVLAIANQWHQININKPWAYLVLKYMWN